jgi:hypothetical protein
MTSQRLFLILFAVLAGAVVLTTPVMAGFALRPFTCDFGPSTNWPATITNLKHLGPYGVMAALAFFAFRNSPVWLPIALVLLITAAVELSQAIFNDGHCRIARLAMRIIPRLASGSS